MCGDGGRVVWRRAGGRAGCGVGERGIEVRNAGTPRRGASPPLTSLPAVPHLDRGTPHTTVRLRTTGIGRARVGRARQGGARAKRKKFCAGSTSKFFVGFDHSRPICVLSTHSVCARAPAPQAYPTFLRLTHSHTPMHTTRLAAPVPLCRLRPSPRLPRPTPPPTRRRQREPVSWPQIAAVVQVGGPGAFDDDANAATNTNTEMVLYTKADCPLCAGLEVIMEWGRGLGLRRVKVLFRSTNPPFLLSVQNPGRPRQSVLPALPPDRRHPHGRRHRVPAGWRRLLGFGSAYRCVAHPGRDQSAGAAVAAAGDGG